MLFFKKKILLKVYVHLTLCLLLIILNNKKYNNNNLTNAYNKQKNAVPDSEPLCF